MEITDKIFLPAYSPLPRSVHSNIAMSFYGQEIDLLEFSVRQENLQKLLAVLMKKSDPANELKKIENEDSQMYELSESEPKISLEATLLGDFRISEEFDQNRIESDFFNNFWDKIWKKVSNFDLLGALNEMNDVYGGVHEIESLKREAILGIMTHSVPTILGSEITFKLDSIAAMNLEITGAVNSKLLDLIAIFLFKNFSRH